jgi:hypothetical protein
MRNLFRTKEPKIWLKNTGILEQDGRTQEQIRNIYRTKKP